MNLMQVKINANATSDTNDYANGSNLTQPSVTAVGTINSNAERRWWSSLLLLGIIFGFGLCVLSPGIVISQTNPYYPNTATPPAIQQTINDSTGAIEVNVCAPDGKRTETFNVYKNVSGVRTLIGRGTLANEANLSISIPNTEITKDMILEVTSKQQNLGSEFVEWRDTIDYDIARNPNNPFDYYGRIHNEGLDYYINNRTYFGHNPITMMDDIMGRVADFALTKPELENENINDISLNTSILPPQVENPQVNSSIKALYKVIYSVGDEQLNVYGVSNCVKRIKQLENGMSSKVARGMVSAEAASDFYKMSAVAKYSLTYWYDVATDNNSPWRDYEDYEDNEEIPPSFWSDLKKAVTAVVDFVADNISNVAGIMFCAGLDVGGATTGPLNAIASSIAGGVLWGSGQYPFPGWQPWI